MKVHYVCPHCKGKIFKRLEDRGYISGRDLGRPAGAKGIDCARIYWSCEQHGEIEPVRLEIPEWFDGLPTEWTNRWGDSISIVKGEVFDPWGNLVDRLPSEPTDVQEWLDREPERGEEWDE